MQNLSEIDTDTLQGMELLAYSNTSDLDFALLRFKEEIPDDWNVYYAGWTCVENSLTNGVSIHHPSGDIKKISTSDSIVLDNDKYWDVFWTETKNGFGITETGSSGSPLFDSDSLIIGVLSGGFSSCATPHYPDNYTRFSLLYDKYSSASNSLKSWLDPDKTSIKTLAGMSNKKKLVLVLLKILTN